MSVSSESTLTLESPIGRVYSFDCRSLAEDRQVHRGTIIREGKIISLILKPRGRFFFFARFLRDRWQG